MQRESGPGNRTLRFNVDLLFPAGQLQRFHVAVCKVLRDVVSLTLGKIETWRNSFAAVRWDRCSSRNSSAPPGS